jgi:glycosyltransferase involved in cell wall biosynthesis
MSAPIDYTVMPPPSLSIIIPVYNEAATIEDILERLISLQLKHVSKIELILVNDASSDDTDEKIKSFIKSHPQSHINYLIHIKNQGKGAALRTGFENASHDYVVVQDADLEYDPSEIDLLFGPVLYDGAEVVYGSRFIGGKPHRILFFWHTIGNKFLTGLSNICTNLNLSDMETCYKLIKRDILNQIQLKENRFGFEPEVTAKLARIKKIKIYEVGISYYGRTYEEGKKISWRDGFRAIYCILKYNWFR